MNLSRFIIIIFILATISVGAVYYKYIVLHDFVFFTNEEMIPDQFDVASYLN